MTSRLCASGSFNCIATTPFVESPVQLRGGAVWQLVGLITRRSQVRILPPLPNFKGVLTGHMVYTLFRAHS